MGTVRVACWIAAVAAAPTDKITSGASATISPAYLRVRSGSPSVKR